MAKIQFGTSGWRGIFCEDFTFENVRVVCRAIADHLLADADVKRGVVVGYDSRFMGEMFARQAVEILSGAGIPSFLCNRDTPTPVIAYEILRRQAVGGINFTASHNPAEYNGIKFSPATGGPALPETTHDIEQRANAMLGTGCDQMMPLATARQEGLLLEIDPCEDYLRGLDLHLDTAAIVASGMTMAVNTLHGTGRGYLDTYLRRLGVNVLTMNDRRDPTFGGLPPEPAAEYMPDFISLVAGDPQIKLGLATDGDADRFGVVDGDGTFIEPNYILALLADYLLRRRGRGDLARSVATSHLLDAVAAHHGVKVYETPVGFKYIGEMISAGKILIGGEESAGLTVRGHVPEKDGILACLLVAEMVAVEKKSLRVLLDDLYARVGTFCTRRQNITLSPELEAAFPQRIATPPTELAGCQVERVVTVDGTKLLLAGGGWVLFRKSGTEPVVRVYAEAGSEAQLEILLKAAVAFIQ